MRRFAFICMISAVFAAPGIASDDATFAEANRQFENGNFESAIQIYSDLADSGNVSPDLYHNLGTAFYRSGDPGSAALWLRRALLFDDQFHEARQSLTFLSRETGLLEFDRDGVGQFLRDLPRSLLRWAFGISVWISAILFTICFVSNRLRPLRGALISVGILGSMLAIASGLGLYYQKHHFQADALHLVTAPTSLARTAPALSAKKVIDLPPGSELRLLEASGEWFYVEIPDQLRGWIRKDYCEPIWPITKTD
ncbi:MAG: SH3 domain-containing protein [Verrucomicrobiota bacterium]